MDYSEYLKEHENESVQTAAVADSGMTAAEALGETKGKNNKAVSFTKKGLVLLLAAVVLFSGLVGAGVNMAMNGGFDGTSVFQRDDNRGGNPFDGFKAPDDKVGDKDNNLNRNDVVLGSGAGTTLEKATRSELSIAEIASVAADTVVEIRTESVTTSSWIGEYVTSGAGSGVIISQDGYIVTNNHVIENAKTISVTLRDGTEYDAVLVGTDEQTDVAVIKIEATGLKSAYFGDSDELVVGDLAVVIGNPLGKLGGSVTAGIISALDREITIDGRKMNLIQTDAGINLGNSGGGLFNDKGEMVGMVVAKSGGNTVEDLGFVIPINTVKAVAEDLVAHGFVTGRPILGVTLLDLTTVQQAMQYGVRNLGLYIYSADTEGAKASGLQQGDMLYYVGDTRINTNSDLQSELAKHQAGDTVDVSVIRNGEIVNLKLVLSEKTE